MLELRNTILSVTVYPVIYPLSLVHCEMLPLLFVSVLVELAVIYPLSLVHCEILPLLLLRVLELSFVI